MKGVLDPSNDAVLNSVSAHTVFKSWRDGGTCSPSV